MSGLLGVSDTSGRGCVTEILDNVADTATSADSSERSGTVPRPKLNPWVRNPLTAFEPFGGVCR